MSRDTRDIIASANICMNVTVSRVHISVKATSDAKEIQTTF